MIAQQTWRSRASQIFYSIFLVSFFGIVKTIVDYIADLNNLGSVFDYIDSGRADFVPDKWDIMGYTIALLIIIGYFMYFSGLKKFSALQYENDEEGVLKIRSGAIWSLIAVFLDYIPLIGSFLFVLFSIIGFFIMLGGYSRLKHSSTFPKDGKSGAGTAYASMIVGVIGTILGLIPIAGSIFDGILSFIAFIMLLCGWARIKNAKLPEGFGNPIPAPVNNMYAGMGVAQPAVNVAGQASVSDELRTKVSAKTDGQLEQILANPEEYNAAFVQATREEKNSREKRKQADEARLKIKQKTDSELAHILTNRDEYSLIYAEIAMQEQSERSQQRELEERQRREEKAKIDAAARYMPNFKEKETIHTELAVDKTPPVDTTSQVVPPKADNTQTDFTSAPPKTRNNGVLIAGIIVGILLLGGVLSYIFLYIPYAKDRDALRTYVYADNLFLRSSQLAGIEYNVIGKIPYGAELITYNKNAEWAEIKFMDQKGYVASPYILEKADFALLNNAWGNADARECISSTKCRNAIMHYLKECKLATGNNDWQIYTKGKDQKPNTVFYPRVFDSYSKFTDFAFIIKNNATGQRNLAIYSFNDETEVPIFRMSLSGVPTEGYIQSITTNRGKMVIRFSNGEIYNYDL